MVEQEPNGNLDLWPRGHFKSTIISESLTIQEILKNPEITVIIFSNVQDIATATMRPIKLELERNETLKELFPDILYEDPSNESSQWNEDAIVVKRKANRKEPTVEAMGLLTGLKPGRHADILVFDDTVTDKSVTTAEQIVKTTMAFESALQLGTQAAVHRLIGTRYSYNDTYSDLLSRQAYKQRIFTATDNGKIDGKPIFFTQEQWDQIVATRSTYTISCQYLQDPLSAAERVFDINNLEYYEVRPQRMYVFILVDPAHSKKKDSADTAMAVIGVAGRKRKYLLDGFCHKMSLSDRYKNLHYLYWKWKAETGVINVRVGYETYGAGEVDLEYIKEMMKRDKFYMRIEELTAPGGGVSTRKNDRIERIQPDLNAHQIFVPYATDPNRLTKAQLIAKKKNQNDLISKPIRRMNSFREVYDVTDVFKLQLNHFPLSLNKDFIDAFSRIYDMPLSDPQVHRGSYSIPLEMLT